MRYEERRPPPDLAGEIECFWLVTGHGDEGKRLAERIVPDGCVELIVHLADPFARPDGEVQPRGFVVGEMTRPIVVAPTGAVRTLGVRFRPGQASCFIGMPLAELTDRAATLEEIWESAGGALELELRNAPDQPRRIAAAERFLRRRRSLAPAADPRVAWAVRQILRNRGNITVEELARGSDLSVRQLERRFRARVGLSPKLLCRVVRFQGVFHAIGSDGATGWARVALECGYFDQAHLIRDFRDFAGDAPAAFLAEEGELSRRFTSPARLSALFEEGEAMSASSKTARGSSF